MNNAKGNNIPHPTSNQQPAPHPGVEMGDVGGGWHDLLYGVLAFSYLMDFVSAIKKKENKTANYKQIRTLREMVRIPQFNTIPY